MTSLDQVIAVGLKEGKSVDDFAVDFRESISELTADDSVLVLADIVGGSPLTTAARSRRSWKVDWSLNPWWDEPPPWP